MAEFNWEAIEAISSVIGGVCVVVSVLFLIYEVRHNAKAIEGQTVQSLMSLEREVFALLADNADLFTRGRDHRAALTPEEQFQFDRIASSYMSLTYSAYIQFTRNLIEQEVWDAYLDAARRYTVHPGFVAAWDGF